MPTIQYTAQLDFTDNGTFETGWRIKQGDFGDCEIVFRVVNNGVNMYDALVTPEIVFRRADGASVISNMTPNDGTYKYTFVGNELAVPGPTLVDVKYTDSEGRISTASCRFTVVEDTIGYDPTGAHTYDNPVSELVETATAAAETAIDSSFKAEGFAVGEQGGVPVEEGSPYYHNNSKYFSEESASHAEESSGFADDAEAEALVSEGWANGEQNGEPVEQGSPYYHNNSKYWSQQSNPTRFSNLSDVNFGTLEDDEIPVYDATSQKWKNEVGVSTDLKSNTTGQFNTRTGGILNSCVVNIEPKQSGSGTPSPDNVRPITGHSSVEVLNCGFNLWDEEWENGSYDGSGNKGNNGVTTYLRSKNLIPCEPNKNYYIKAISENTKVLYYDFNGQFIQRNDVTANATFTSINNAYYMKFWVYDSTPNSYLEYNNNICINVSDTSRDGTYEKFTGNESCIVNLGQTVYGGSVDVVSGVLIIDGYGVEYDGSNDENWSVSLNRYMIALNPRAVQNNDTVNILSCNKYVGYSTNSLFPRREESGFSGVGSTDALIVIDNVQSTTADLTRFKADLANNPLKVVYKLATPIIIQLTPTQIETLIGQNTVTTPLDGQSLDSLTYREVLAWDDVERAINVKLDLSSVAPIEYTDKASQSYNQKQLFIKDNKLCQALASISSGASFTENTNFKYTTLAEIIEPLIP